jgi:Hemerythrin HHE cation binding domain
MRLSGSQLRRLLPPFALQRKTSKAGLRSYSSDVCIILFELFWRAEAQGNGLFSQPSSTTRMDQGSTSPSVGTACPGELPPISSAERKHWDYYSESMDAYHRHHAHTFRALRRLADPEQRQSEGYRLSDYLRMAQRFHGGLHTHHNIEETYLFPVVRGNCWQCCRLCAN